MAEVTLDELNTNSEGFSLEDLEIDNKAITVNRNNKSHEALTVLTAATANNVTESDVEGMSWELENSNKSAFVDKTREERGGEAQKHIDGAVVDMLLDDSVSDEDKVAQAQGYSTDSASKLTVPQHLIAKNIAEDGGEKTEEQVVVRSHLSQFADEYWERKKELQHLVNMEVAKGDSSTVGALGDIFEYYLIPSASGKQAKDILTAMQETLTGESTTDINDLFLVGSANMDLKEMITSLAPDKRIEMAKLMMEVVNSNSGVYLQDENDYAKFDTITRVVAGEYTETDEVIDNIFGVLDVIPFVGALMKGAKALGKGTRTAKYYGDIRGARATGQPDPTSLGVITRETNPKKGVDITEEAMKNEDVAKAAFRSTPEDVAVHAYGPKPTKPSGKVDPAPPMPPQAGDPTVMKSVNRDGQINYTASEKASAKASIQTSFQEAVGLKHRSELSSVGSHPDGGLQIKAVYTAGDAGFSSAKDAREQVKLSLRNYGIKDSEITVLERGVDGYTSMSNELTKTGANELAKTGDYIVQVDFNTKISPLDVERWSGLDVKNNIFDRVGALTNDNQGSLQRHILDAHSMLHPTITLSANVAVDKASLVSRRITDLGEEFGNEFRKMSPEDMALVENYIKKANLEGFSHTPSQLLLQEGFKPEAVKALVAWRKTWDTIYWLENADLVRNLKASGFQALRTDTDNLLVRKTQMNFNNNRVYNPLTKEVETLRPDEIRKLYDEGGYIGESRTMLPLDGEDIAHVLVKNDTSSYAVGLRETDAILEYRQGYYQVNYDAPVFIDRIVRDSKGVETRRYAVGMARDAVEANLMREKFAKAEGVSIDDFGAPRENKAQTRAGAEDRMEMTSAMGRSAQRVRGERLQEATQPVTGGIDGSLVQDPIDALTNAARSIANRVSMRDWLSSSKARFVEQYGDYISREINGSKTFPRSLSEIAKPGETVSKGIADARTTWEYINYMEHGYINILDEGLKAGMRTIGWAMGKRGFGLGQRGMEALASGRGVTGTAKGTAFQLYIALNPARQILVQSHQMVRLTAINPGYALVDMVPQLIAVQKARLTGGSTPLLDFVMNSGQIDSITRTNLLTDALTEITHQSRRGLLGRTKDAATKISHYSQKIGFEFGESNNVITSLLAFRDLAIRQGKNLDDPAVVDRIYAEARNFTYNMTKAGDQPYNQNAAGLVMQFLQVPHKAIVQPFTNRVMTPKQKASALFTDTVMFGLPGYAIWETWFAESLPEDPVVRESMKRGMEGLAFNSLINIIADEHSALDWTSLSPTSGQGFADLFTRFTEEGMQGLVSKSPAGQMFLGTNPRITNFLKNTMAFAGVRPDLPPVDFYKLSRSFAMLSSGMSNFYKARYIEKWNQVKNSSGKVIVEHATQGEAYGQLFGLPPEKVRRYYDTKGKLFDKSEAFREDVNYHYNNIKKNLALAGDDISATDEVMETMAMGWVVFEDYEYEARKQFAALIKKDAKEGDFYLIEKLYKASGIMTPKEWKMLVQDSPLSEENKKNLLDVGEKMDKFRNEE